MLIKKEPPKSEAKSKLPKTTTPAPSLPAKSPTKAPAVKIAKTLNTAKSSSFQTKQKTRIIVKCDVGFHNRLYIRGQGAQLNWDRGQPLKNVKADEWVWETDSDFITLEFKVLINDQHYEIGENHSLRHGSSVIYSPRF